MQVFPNRLAEHLQKGLQPFYLVFGDEPQQKLETISKLRQAARQAGFDERQSLVADSGFQWNQLLDACQSLSLFSARQMVELELATGKPGAEGGKLLASLAEAANRDLLLVIHGGRIGKDVQASKWFKALDKQGLYIPCHPLEGRALMAWVSDKVRSSGLTDDPQLVKLLCDYCEGNLLAARQEIDKLALLFPNGKVSIEQAQSAMLDQSRFNVFQLVDVLLSGDADKAVKILYRLESEGVEPTVICWALVREWQTLFALKFAQQQGTPLASLWQQHRIWSNRQAIYQRALGRLSLAHLERMQAKLSAFDQAIKQSSVARPYVELCHLCLLFIPLDLTALELDYL